ncbi:FAD-dependent monooxygenase [Streptomyces sp. J2-1]|uniref:FAD-dependent oxidoreductase n=1 Tax=Streptomyces corallincola TaxID=2851888 RepID=UPI001C393771|nr:FAD-dependent oxidoreductase [Streptomyces corallincola]MBV2357393.1 FAD-dependent monooxygenase [Streptomyces corallincola]
MARILVIGGGIAGTAAALGLDRAGHEVEVYEAHPDAAEDIGAFLTLASNGMRALAQLGATDAVTAVGFPLTSLRLLDARGTEIGAHPLTGADDPALRYRCLPRGVLNAALQAELTRRGITLNHGARLASLTETPDTVTARFTDGTTATGDLLIGADGLHSAVRALAVAPGTVPVHAGQRVYYGRTPAPAPGPAGAMTMVRGGSAAFGYAVSPQGETYWFARVAGDALPAGTPADGVSAGSRGELLALLRGDDTPCAEIVAGCGRDLMAVNATELPLGTPWHTGRIMLVGDAAHAASPATGQGASMALEDAVVLAKALRDAPGRGAAFALHERLRRTRAERNITVSGGISRGTRVPGRAPAAPPTGTPSPDEGLNRLLDWETPLDDPAGA